MTCKRKQLLPIYYTKPCVFLEVDYNSLCKNRFTYKQKYLPFIFATVNLKKISIRSSQTNGNTMMPTRDTTQTRLATMYNRLQEWPKVPYTYLATTTTIVVVAH